MTRRYSSGHLMILLLLWGAWAALSLERVRAADADWPTHGGTSLEQRYSTLGELNSGNVRQLGLTW